ncbi:MAG: hypothetical protein ACJAQ9_001988 [Ilumatobacter sp.]|jgi:hypothetical protein
MVQVAPQRHARSVRHDIECRDAVMPQQCRSNAAAMQQQCRSADVSGG